MGELEDRVVESIFAKFDALPIKSKPRVSSEGSQEWVPLSGIAIVKGLSPPFPGSWGIRELMEYIADEVTCISLGQVQTSADQQLRFHKRH